MSTACLSHVHCMCTAFCRTYAAPTPSALRAGDLTNMTLGDSYEQMVRLIPQRTWLGTEFGLSVEDLLEMLPVRSAQEAAAEETQR